MQLISGSPAVQLLVLKGNRKHYNNLSCLYAIFSDSFFTMESQSRAVSSSLVLCLPRLGPTFHSLH